MKLDLVEIGKLSPPTLWDVGVLSAFIACLLRAVDAGVGTRLVYGRMVLRFSQELREKVRENLNMRIKAWVLQCPDRIAWVRHVIGEVAIRHWRQNHLLDYALTKYFGDWQTKFSDGFTRKGTQKRRDFSTKFIRKIRAYNCPYNWKPFALVKIKNVTGFLYGKTTPDLECEEQRVAHLKLWGVDSMDAGNTPKSKHPRTPRALKPVRFTHSELALKAAEETAQDVVEDGRPHTVREKSHPPDDPKNLETNTVWVPDVDKPP